MTMPSPPPDNLALCLRGMPRRLKIGAYDWTIVVLDEESDKYGQSDFELNYIRLWQRNLTSAAHAVGIVIHECLHVIFDNHDLGRLKRGKDEREEQIVLGYEAGLISLFRDNPKFLIWMKRWLG